MPAAPDGLPPTLEDVGVDHGGFHILIAEQFLNGANVVAVLEKMSVKTMPESVGGNGLINFCQADGFFYGLLLGSLVNVMPPDDAGVRIRRTGRCREYILPGP